MDSASPFQPWTSDDSAKNVKSERDLLVDDAKLHRENVNHPKHRQTASYDKESVAVPSSASGSSGAAGSGADPAQGMESKMDSSKIASMQQIVENTLSQEGRQRVGQLLEAVEALSGAERLMLYLRLPTGVPPHDPLKQPINPLGSRAELQQTVIWIQTHLEVDPDVSLPKQDVYDEYIAHCMSSNMKPLSTADFGKVMKQVYPTVRPRRLGTRGNSRYCYAGLRKKIKLEVPQLPDLGESSKEPIILPTREPETVVCEWAESKLGIKCTNISELARHLSTALPTQHTVAPGPVSVSPPPLPPQHGHQEDAASRQLIKHLKRKMQAQGTPGRPKKNKAQDAPEEPQPSTSYAHHPPLKHESPPGAESVYPYQPPYVYDVRPSYPHYPVPRALPPHPSHSPHAPHPPPGHEYRPDPYAFESPYAARDLTRAADSHNLPINLSSDASLDLSTERGEWQRRRPPEPPPRLPLPGKKLILETYQSETRSGTARVQPPPPPPEDFPRTEYLPKKMRAAEIMGGKLAATRQAAAEAAAAASAAAAAAAAVPVDAPALAPAEASVHPGAAFLEDPKNLTNRSKSTAAALAREEQEAASLTQSNRMTTKLTRQRLRAGGGRAKVGGASPHRTESPHRPTTPDSCCGLDGINMKTGVICEEKHLEILNRERVISICNIDKHDLDDYLNEPDSQEHEEELLQYFQQRAAAAAAAAATVATVPSADVPQPVPPHASDTAAVFLESAGQDPHDDHSQGKNEKISQLRELLAKNLKNHSGTSGQSNQETLPEKVDENFKTAILDGAFKPHPGSNTTEMNGAPLHNHVELTNNRSNDTVPLQNGTSVPYVNNNANQLISNVAPPHLFNGHHHNEPQSPTTRTQQYEFVPISDGCHSPGNFNSKSPLGFGVRGPSPTKVNKQIIMGGSLQTSPTSHSTVASPFVSPRNTPVPRSRFCSRPIPKLNGRKRRNPLSLGVTDPSGKPFVVPNDQKFVGKSPICGPGKYYQPMSAPPSPNILTSQYKGHIYPCATGIPNGISNSSINFLAHAPFRDHANGDQPLSADPLSSEVSQFFQETMLSYRPGHDSFRSQSVPLKQAPLNNIGMLSYNNTPVGSVPPTPIPNEFCDFGNLADACDISKAGLNSETLDKIYNAIDSSNDVLNTDATQSLLNSNDGLSNGSDRLAEQQILSDDQLTSLIPSGDDLLDRTNQYNSTFGNGGPPTDNVEDFLKRANSMEFEFSGMVNDKSKYYTSRSVPSTPLPFKRAVPNLQIGSRRSRELFAAENYSNASNGISSKSVPSTPQFAEDRSVFSYSNRDYLINGNSVSGTTQIHDNVVESEQGLTSPLHDNLEEILVDPLTPALLVDLDKIDGAPYGDL